jgi:hypothetical protein
MNTRCRRLSETTSTARSITSGRFVQVARTIRRISGTSPKENEWNKENLGFKEKDWLEAEVCREVKAGQLDPKEAYQKLTTDWVAYYHEMRSQSDQDVVDKDDE